MPNWICPKCRCPYVDHYSWCSRNPYNNDYRFRFEPPPALEPEPENPEPDLNSVERKVESG